MMQKRRYTRSNAWHDMDATIKVTGKLSYKKIEYLTVRGKVENLGSSGMFLLTNELVPVPATAEIVINFDCNACKPEMVMKASGKTVRLTKQGVGIRFTAIDLKKLQKCIVRKINASDLTECIPEYSNPPH